MKTVIKYSHIPSKWQREEQHNVNVLLKQLVVCKKYQGFLRMMALIMKLNENNLKLVFTVPKKKNKIVLVTTAIYKSPIVLSNKTREITTLTAATIMVLNYL